MKNYTEKKNACIHKGVLGKTWSMHVGISYGAFQKASRNTTDHLFCKVAAIIGACLSISSQMSEKQVEECLVCVF